MITITKAEEEVLNQVKSYSDDKMDVSIIKEDLGIYEHDLNDRLMKLGYDLTKFALEYAEEVIFNLKLNIDNVKIYW